MSLINEDEYDELSQLVISFVLIVFLLLALLLIYFSIAR